MEELKRAQEMRVDEFSMHFLRERESCYNTGDHFIDTGTVRKGELYE